jgi:uridine phosphorylase
MSDIRVHHVSVCRDDVASEQPGGRFFFVPGSSERAREIADQFEERREFGSGRGHDVFTGVLRFGDLTVDVGSVSTGMGCPSLDIIVNELLCLGVNRFLRIGTAGSLQPDHVKPGDTVISTGAVRDESTSSAYAPPSVPSVASFAITESLIRASQQMEVAFPVHAGLVHSKDAFFAREHRSGPLGKQSSEFMQSLKDLGVLATEMEASHLFMLAQTKSSGHHHVNTSASALRDGALAGAVLAIVGGEGEFESAEVYKAAVRQAIGIGIAAVGLLYAQK